MIIRITTGDDQKTLILMKADGMKDFAEINYCDFTDAFLIPTWDIEFQIDPSVDQVEAAETERMLRSYAERARAEGIDFTAERVAKEISEFPSRSLN
jgi:aminoglycoside/choline kinase family phosphotransferase